MTSCCEGCEIYFIRHGETDWNLQDRIQGHTDIPLNATGISQSAQLGELLADIPFTAAFSSDLARARQTAELALYYRQLPITTLPALRERSAGRLEGLNRKKLDQELRSFLISEQALNRKTYLESAWHPELETMHSVFTRVTNALFPLAAYHQGQSLLVVTHGGVLRSLLDHLSFTPRKRWVVDNCGFIKIKIAQHKLNLLDYHRVSSKHIV